MMKRLVFGVTIVLLLLLQTQPANAVTLDTNCTSGVYTELLYNGSAVMYNNTFTCSGGCADNGLECDSPADPQIFFAFAIAFGLAALTFAYIGLRLNENHKPLQMMFIIFSVVYVAFTSYVVSGFTLLTLNSLNTVVVGAYSLGVMTVLGVVFYFIYLLVLEVLGLLKIRKESGRPFKW